MAYLTVLGALAGPPTEIELEVAPQYERGQEVIAASSGCLGCHKIGENGNTLGPNLTEIGDRLGARRDRAHAREPDRADAVVRSAARREPGAVRAAGRVPRRRSKTERVDSRSDRRRPERGTLPEPQVRAMFDRIARRLRPHERGHDGRHAPALARARRRARRSCGRATARSTWRPARATSPSS